MNKNRLLWVVVALLALNFLALAVHTVVLRGRSGKTESKPDEPFTTVSQAGQPPKNPAVLPPPQPQPLNLLKCEQVEMSSNRLAKVRLLFNGPVATNSLVSSLSFKAAGDDVTFRISHVTTNLQSVTVDLLTPIQGSLVTATLKEGTLPAPESTLFLPSAATAKVGCALSPGLAVQGISANQTSFGSTAIHIQFNQRVTAANAKRFFHVSPAVDFSVSVASHSSWEEDESIIVLSGGFKSDRQYEVNVASGFRARNGMSLLKSVSREVKIPSLAPACEFASHGRYLAPSEDFIIPLKAVNITNVEVHAEHLLPANIVQFVMRETDGYSHWNNWWNDEANDAEYLTVDAIDFSVPVRAPQNEPHVVPCRLGESLKTRGRGAYLVRIRPTSDKGSVAELTRVICASDIGLSLLLDQEAGIAHAWVTVLSTGAARAGVRVALRSDRNELLGEAVSGASGLAKIKFDAKKTPIALVGSDPGDGDLTFLPIASKSNVNVIHAGKALFVNEGEYEAFLFTDRGIFRPGETVFLQALLRNNRAEAPSKVFPVELLVSKPDGKLFKKMTIMSDMRGSLKAEIAIPEFLPTGRYTAEVRTPGKDGKVLGDVTFLVESFVPPQIKVSVQAAKDSAVRGESLSATVSAEHLYGAPADGLKTSCGVTFLPSDFKPSGWERYKFGDRSVKFNGGAEKDLAEALLDADGHRTLTFKVPGDLRAPARALARVRGTVFENGGRTVTAYAKVVVDTAPYYIGIDTTDREWVNGDEDISFPWATVRPDGSPEKGVDSLSASLIRLDTHWNFTVNSDGHYEWHRESSEYAVMEGLKISAGNAEGQGQCSFKVPEWGEYRLVITDSKTGASASHKFWASWGGKRPVAMDSFTMLEIVPDKKCYAPGENAKLQIRAPFAGELFIVIKQDKVLQSRSVTITDKTTEVVLPITASIAPGVEIFASVVRAAKPEEVWAPHRAVGTCFVGVQPPERALSVSVEVPEVIRPSATADVTVRIAGTEPAAAEGARVTLFSVDEGICGLTDLKTPDPTAFFFAARYGLIDYYDIYTRLMQVTDAKLTGFLSHVGGDDEGLDLGKRLNPISARRFRPVSLKTYDVAVTNGVVVIPVDVPEFTGQLRFMAIAWTTSATGSGEAFARVRRNVVVQPDLPRVLAPGDKSFLSISLDNMTSASTDLKFEIECRGGVAVGKVPDPFSMAGHTRRTITVPIEATGEIGVASVTVRVSTADETFEDTIEIPVRPASPWRTADTATAIAPGESAEFQAATGILESSASQLFEILPRPACDIRSAFGYLTSYPYGCAEQTTSSAFPFLMVNKMPEGYFDDELRSRADFFINGAIVRVLTMQRHDGFSMWPEASDSSRFATYYVIEFLAEAYRAGYAHDLIDREALSAILRHRRWYESWGQNELCTIAFCCALLGEPVEALMMEQYQNTEKLSEESLGRLARAFILAGDPQRARELLEEAGEPTNLRSAAYLLGAWAAIDPGNPLCMICADKIASAKDKLVGHWGTTQDNALAINALLAYVAARGPEEKKPVVSASLSVVTGPKQETIVFPEGASAKWKSAEGQGNAVCRIMNTGEDVCYVRRSFSAVPLAENMPPVTNRLFISRDYLDRDGRILDPSKIMQGDIVVVRLTVKSFDKRDDIVVEDLLPACFEPENQNLVTAGSFAWLPQSDSWRWAIHTEFRDDRVLLFSGDLKAGETYTWHYSARAVSAGDYVVPAVQASAMYDPRIRARGAPSRLTVGK